MNRREAGKLGYEAAKEAIEERNQRLRKEYFDNPTVCLQCGTALPYERDRRSKFCNHSCAARYCNKERKQIRHCNLCGWRVVDNPNRRRCDECRKDGPTRLEDAQSDQTRKRILVRQRGHKCEQCGLTEWQGVKIPIELEHSDGNPDNNTAENLKLLCRNCHGITPTFGARIKGKTAKRCKIRRDRYIKVSDAGKA